MASLIDTNVLVYSFDPRDRHKQQTADRLLRKGMSDDRLVVPHQALVEFIAATTRPRPELGGEPLLSRQRASREVEDLMVQFTVIYPDESVVTTALHGAAAFQLSWYDAHMWAYAQVNGLDEILSEDFEHGRRYGAVRVRDPFLAALDEVHELPPLYDD